MKYQKNVLSQQGVLAFFVVLIRIDYAVGECYNEPKIRRIKEEFYDRKHDSDRQ